MVACNCTNIVLISLNIGKWVARSKLPTRQSIPEDTQIRHTQNVKNLFPCGRKMGIYQNTRRHFFRNLGMCLWQYKTLHYRRLWLGAVSLENQSSSSCDSIYLQFTAKTFHIYSRLGSSAVCSWLPRWRAVAWRIFVTAFPCRWQCYTSYHNSPLALYDAYL